MGRFNLARELLGCICGTLILITTACGHGSPLQTKSARERSYAADDALNQVRNDLGDIQNWRTEESDPYHSERVAYLRARPSDPKAKQQLAYVAKLEADGSSASARLHDDKEKAAEAVLALKPSDPSYVYLRAAWNDGNLDEDCLLAGSEAISNAPGADGTAQYLLSCQERHGLAR